MAVASESSQGRASSNPRFAKTILRVFLGTLVWLFIALGAVLIGVATWIRRTFGYISVDQMLMNLPGAGGVNEATNAESGYISSFIWQALAIPLGAVALLGILTLLLRTAWKSAQGDPNVLGLSAAFTPRLLSAGRSMTRALHLGRWLPGLVSVGVLALGIMIFTQTIGLSQYVQSATTTRSMGAYYAVPVVEQRPEMPENLITIYLESMEDAFSDTEMFEEDMLLPLKQATKGWGQIDSLRQYDGGGWTMAGIVGTQCGVPLRGTQTAKAGKLEAIGKDSNEYLPGATCLGDVLSAEGYTNVFMGGADADFASKRLFLSTHGYDEVFDLDTWVERGDTEFSDWGLSDRALMERAREEVDRLHAADQPFNLTMLTLDSHEPAHAFDYCPIDTEIEMTSITRCSMEQVAGFIEYLEMQGYLEDTAVVLMGDHERFVHDKSDYKQLLELDERTIFNRIWSPNGVEIQHDDIDQLSMEATMLDLLGIKVQGNRAGVGASAITAMIGRGSVFELSPDLYTEVIRSRSSDLYSLMWGLSAKELETADYFDPKNPPAPSEQEADSSVQPRNLTR